jgi:DNA-binding response OmpR family regulator
MSLAGRRILVVEDEMLISLLIEDILADQDCVIIGPFDRVAAALGAAQNEDLDAALLDVNVAGVKIYPVAEVLAARGIPFMLLSGYGADAIPSGHPDWRACSKPFRPEDLVDGLLEGIKEKGNA